MSTMSSTATRPATAGPFVRWIGACAHALAVYFDRRSAIKALHELDDRALRDIGLARCHIEAVVGGALNPGMARLR
jgi:uncharacterized protein YjiS (DUF1127 family)